MLEEQEVTKNFNFKSLISLSSGGLPALEEIDLNQLQTLEQFFFKNYKKAKASYQAFAVTVDDAKKALEELKHLAEIQKEVNSFLSPESSGEGTDRSS